ncbi:DUF1552 domain-containing protein [Novosphingobium aerophilum]|uniref:DUF1552 domain-containing protein n=1 Tax=Novosphingobium aerophilum TaxID=2839843 RepID=A0A7X1F4Z3_9SPHN|nr:DUF1552 domain-containing protein [Novosphingobium aerophilum]MBC2650485.1 DUF1552 domain-containing protein [Novosphingobium aerophilum]
MAMDLTRRSALRGMLNGAAITVGVPLLDAFLDINGEAMAATGSPVPVRFGTWFWGLGVNPNRWFPDKAGPGYDLKPELAPIRPFAHKINILGNFNVMLDGAPNLPHSSGGAAIRTGRALTAERGLPGESFDVAIGDRIGTRTRFRSLEMSAAGDARNSLSGRGGGNLNPSETSASALYQRLFGTGFQDPNSATFVPDPVVMARRSVLSAVGEQRKALVSAVGAADRQKLDQYFTSVRQLENQLAVELTKPEPMPACIVPRAVRERPVNAEIETAVANHALMTDLLVMALACDQTRVFNMMFNNGASSLTRIGSTITHHQLTHEEALDNRLGYQPEASYFLNRIMEAWVYFVGALDRIQEGPRTLLDNTLVFAHSETEFAKFHTIDNIPMMTAGSAGGRVRTGLYVDGQGTPVSRVGLTLQQIMGVSIDTWGTQSMTTGKSIGEIVA